MASIREQILTKIVSVLNAGNIGAPVDRSRTEAVSREQSPRVIVLPGSDVARQSTVPFLDWTMAVHVVVYVRGSQPDSLADPIIAAAHASLMADETLGGLAMTILPASVHFELVDSDATACVVTCEYRIQYRTSQQDITT